VGRAVIFINRPLASHAKNGQGCFFARGADQDLLFFRDIDGQARGNGAAGHRVQQPDSLAKRIFGPRATAHTEKKSQCAFR